jgi:hypothetical protein
MESRREELPTDLIFFEEILLTGNEASDLPGDVGSNGAGDEDRTRNFQLGKLTLYH